MELKPSSKKPNLPATSPLFDAGFNYNEVNALADFFATLAKKNGKREIVVEKPDVDLVIDSVARFRRTEDRADQVMPLDAVTLRRTADIIFGYAAAGEGFNQMPSHLATVPRLVAADMILHLEKLCPTDLDQELARISS